MQTIVIGHRNPDMDAICSAIAYAEFKRKLGMADVIPYAAGGFQPGEKWTVRETNCEAVTLERNGKIRQFRPSSKGKWDVLISSTMQVSVGDQIRVTRRFRVGKNVFKYNDIAEVREITDIGLVLNDGRQMRRDGSLHHLVCKPMPYGRPGRRVAGRL